MGKEEPATHLEGCRETKRRREGEHVDDVVLLFCCLRSLEKDEGEGWVASQVVLPRQATSSGWKASERLNRTQLHLRPEPLTI